MREYICLMIMARAGNKLGYQYQNSIVTFDSHVERGSTEMLIGENGIHAIKDMCCAIFKVPSPTP